MRVSLTVAEIRQVVVRVFRQHGAPLLGADELDERLRIEEGRLVARTYRANGLFAMWMVEVGLLQFYDVNGDMLRSINLFVLTPADRIAA